MMEVSKEECETDGEMKHFNASKENGIDKE